MREAVVCGVRRMGSLRQGFGLGGRFTLLGCFGGDDILRS